MNVTINKAIYNSIGKTYDSTRQADPIIIDKIIPLLSKIGKQKIIDIGCGSGNYTIALKEKGLNIEGIDVSEEMIEKAKQKFSDIKWHLGDARSLPFDNGEFTDSICILATHHIKDLNAAFRETYRVIASGGKFIIFTSTPMQMNGYWLDHYFPTIIPNTTLIEFKDMKRILEECNFRNVCCESFFIGKDHKDLFLHGGKYKPEIYLDPMVRAGISSFALATNRDELNAGLNRLAEDIESGEIDNVIRKYENDIGDYLFVVAQKP